MSLSQRLITYGSPPITGSTPTSATAQTRNRRASWKTCAATPRTTCATPLLTEAAITGEPIELRALNAHAAAWCSEVNAAAADLDAAEVLQVAKTQRWTPEEILRTLVEAEIAARDASNTANRLKAAAFPVIKSLDGFDVGGSSVTQATFDYLSSLEWIRAQQNLAVVGPPGTGRSHLLVGCGHATVHAGFKVRYFTAAA